MKETKLQQTIGVIKNLFRTIKQRLLFLLAGSLKKTDCIARRTVNSGNYIINNNDIYMNYLRKTAGTPNQQWNRIIYVIKYPILIIALCFGFIPIPFIFLCDGNIFIKTLLTTISTIGLGVGINYFTFYLKESNEYKILGEIGSNSIRLLGSKIEKILSKSILSQEDKNDITDFISLIDQWKDYVEFADTSKISYHQRLELEIKQETNVKNKELLESRKTSLEHNWVNNGLGCLVDVSGSTIYNYYAPPRISI